MEGHPQEGWSDSGAVPVLPEKDGWSDILGKGHPREGRRDIPGRDGWKREQCLVLSPPGPSLLKFEYLLLRILKMLFSCVGCDLFLLQEPWEHILCLLSMSGHTYLEDNLLTASTHLHVLMQEERRCRSGGISFDLTPTTPPRTI